MNTNNPYGWPSGPSVQNPQTQPGAYPAQQAAYAPPGYPVTPAAHGSNGLGHRYVPLGWRTPVASVFVVLTGVLAVVSGLLQQGDLRPDATEPGDLALALGVLVASLGYLGAFALAIVFFSIWIHRACTNAWAFGQSSMSITPGWAVGWFFVPFANLVKPFRAMKEVWFGSDPSSAGITPTIIGAWWGTWIVSGILWRLSSKIDGSHLEVVAGLLTAIASVLAVLVMRRIAINQRRLADGASPSW